MPIEIRELIIRAIVEDKPSQAIADEVTDGGAKNKDTIVAECVEQVMEILKDKKER